MKMTGSQDRSRQLPAFALAAFTLTAGLASPAPAGARAGFDGDWSVLIVTEQGECDRAYRYPVRIERGSVTNGGDVAIDISGKVSGNGTITVRVSRGEKSANGSGRLTSAGGSGKWSGGSCAGTWSAERRG
jgi:hypothetical protein